MKNKEKFRLKLLESRPVVLDRRERMEQFKAQRAKNALIGLDASGRPKKR